MRVKTGKPGTSARGGRKAGEAPKGPGWDGGKEGGWVGEGTGTRLGFFHFFKALKTSGPRRSPWRPNLLPEVFLFALLPTFPFPFTGQHSESPPFFLGSAFATKR